MASALDPVLQGREKARVAIMSCEVLQFEASFDLNGYDGGLRHCVTEPKLSFVSGKSEGSKQLSYSFRHRTQP